MISKLFGLGRLFGQLPKSPDNTLQKAADLVDALYTSDEEKLDRQAALADLLSRMDSVALNYDATNGYDSISFSMGSEVLTIGFDSLDAAALMTALGINEAQLDAAFDSGVAPTTTGAAALSTAGLATIDDLFGVDLGAGGIVVTDTLPVELL